jgi:NAD(P)H-dependent FMN reductase
MMTTTSSFLAISGSLRAGSLNTEVLRACAILAPPSIHVTMFDGLASLPHFNPDLDVQGVVLPAGVEDFRSQIGDADALLISSPEYAHGVPGSLKNALDWLVSSSEMLYKPIGLLNISPRSTHAYTSLLEILRTMSTLLIPGALVELPLTRSMVSAERIAANPEIADRLCSALSSLRMAGEQYRLRSADWRSLAAK